jgi:hypothetical protein
VRKDADIRILSAAVADRGQWMGCVSSNVHTNQQLVWDILTFLLPPGLLDKKKGLGPQHDGRVRQHDGQV